MTDLRTMDAEFSDYFYKEATLNPANPRDRATEWEADVINDFRNHPDKPLIEGERETPTGRAMFLARPLVAGASCMKCHSSPERAPAAMVKVYGMANGYGWQQNEIVGAQVISVPVSKATRLVERALYRLIVSFVAVGLLTLIVLNVVIYFTVICALRRFARKADEISRGNLDVPELSVHGQDEISVLAHAFNRMHRSLNAAVKMLDQE